MKRYYYQLFICLLLVLKLSISFSSAQYAQQSLDDRILINLADNRTPEQTGVFMFLSRTYRYGDIGVPAGLFIAGAIDNDKGMRENSLFVASSTALAYGVTELLKFTVKRRRPFVANANIIPVYRASSYSFPSGHTSTTFSTATALSMAYPKWYVIIPSYLWAGSVSYSRMYLGVHYPSDVAAGILIGSGSAASLMFLRNNK